MCSRDVFCVVVVVSLLVDMTVTLVGFFTVVVTDNVLNSKVALLFGESVLVSENEAGLFGMFA